MSPDYFPGTLIGQALDSHKIVLMTVLTKIAATLQVSTTVIYIISFFSPRFTPPSRVKCIGAGILPSR
jgi:hypothetical protein